MMSGGEQEDFGMGNGETWLVVMLVTFAIGAVLAYIILIGVYYYMEYAPSNENKTQALDSKFAEDRDDILNLSHRMPSLRPNQMQALAQGKSIEQEPTQMALVDQSDANAAVMLAAVKNAADSDLAFAEDRTRTQSFVLSSGSPAVEKATTSPGQLSRRSHRRKRSRYYEAEIHSSEATVESEDLPSFRLERQPTLARGHRNQMTLAEYGSNSI